MDNKDAQIFELRSLLEHLLRSYLEVSRLDVFYDLTEDTLVEDVERALGDKGTDLSTEFKLARNVCKRAVKFSRLVEDETTLEKLFDATDKWEKHLRKLGYSF